jgi:hypothetical protein
VQPTFVFRDEEPRPAPTIPHPDQDTVVGAVREDVCQTLRVAWIDPGIDALAGDPTFFTAAWSAVRPNVGRTFLALARRIRQEAVDALRERLLPGDLFEVVRGALTAEEHHRILEVARAAHLAAAKSQIVVHAFRRAAVRDRIPGTGVEEPPVRRGVPEWQQWMAFGPVDEAGGERLGAIARELNSPVPPAAARLLARWPAALEALERLLEPAVRSTAWPTATARVRRAVLGGIGTMPHPVELQWTVLRRRGFGEEDRARVSEAAVPVDAAMPAHTLVAAFLWLAAGAPDVGVDA